MLVCASQYEAHSQSLVERSERERKGAHLGVRAHFDIFCLHTVRELDEEGRDTTLGHRGMDEVPERTLTVWIQGDVLLETL